MEDKRRHFEEWVGCRSMHNTCQLELSSFKKDHKSSPTCALQLYNSLACGTGKI